MFNVKAAELSTRSRVEGNQIYAEKSVHGMRLSASSKFNVLNNFLYLTNDPNHPAPARRLITIQGVDNEAGQENNILLKGNTLTGNGIAAATRSPAGIDVWNSNNIAFCCNGISETDIGVKFNGMNLGTNLRGTTFGNLYDRGLLLTASTKIGPQFEFADMNEDMPTLLYRNQWLNGAASGGAEHLGSEQDAIDSRFKFNPLLNGAMPDPITSNDENWFSTSFVPSIAACNTSSDCGISDMIAPPGPTDGDVRIADGTIGSSLGYNGGVYWEAQRSLYQKLKNNPVLLGQNQQVDQFYNNKSTGRIGAFQQLDKGIIDLFDSDHPYVVELIRLKGSVNTLVQEIRAKDNLLADPALSKRQKVIDEKSVLQGLLSVVFTDFYQQQSLVDSYRAQEADYLISDNNNITTLAPYESNRKTANQVYLNTVAKGVYELDANQLATIEPIAGQCPLSGGNAVYMARGLLSMVKDTIFDDEALCSMANPNSEENFDSETENIEVLVYPNPTDDLFHLSFKAPLERSGTVVLRDMLGKELASYPLEAGNQFFTLSTKNLATGVYFCNFYEENDMINLGKLVIQR